MEKKVTKRKSVAERIVPNRNPARQQLINESMRSARDEEEALVCKKLALAVKTAEPPPYESRARGLCRSMLQPSALGGLTIHNLLRDEFDKNSDFTVSGVIEELAAQSVEVTKGNLERSEGTLVTQAQTLDVIFNHLIQLAQRNMNRLDVAERLFRLAFKSQSQSRATMETLALVKNPPSATFVKQANMASGPQQVNNISRVREIESLQNELLEHNHAKGLESRTAGRAGGRDSQLATVEAIYRTKN